MSPLGGGPINPTIEPPELTQDGGNRLLEGTKKKKKQPCVHQNPGERSSDPTETDPDLL